MSWPGSHAGRDHVVHAQARARPGPRRRRPHRRPGRTCRRCARASALTTYGTPAAAITRGHVRVGQAAAHVIDHPRRRPRSACSATSARMVSMLTQMPAVASAVTPADAPQLIARPGPAARRAGSTRRPRRRCRRPEPASSRPCAMAVSGSSQAAAVGERVRRDVDHAHDQAARRAGAARRSRSRRQSAPARPRASRVVRHSGQSTVCRARPRGTRAGTPLVPWSPPQPAPQPAEAQLRGDPAAASMRRPDQERLGLQRGQADPGRVPGAGEDQEPRHPLRAELGVELVQRLDLEPPRQEQQQPAARPAAPARRRSARPAPAPRGRPRSSARSA